MEKKNLEFCFKGERTYVQGPDIFDSVIQNILTDYDISEVKNIKYAAYALLKSNANLYFTETLRKSDYKVINSIISFIYKDKKISAVVEANDEKIECSQEYSEEVIRTNSIIENKLISFENILDDSLTEIIVSMNKYYLQESVTKDGKWIVTKFDYSKILDIKKLKKKVIHLKLLNNFNNKLTKSVIIVDDIEVGYLYFGLV